MMMTSKTNNSECCMCGDHGIPHELFRCKVCHYRSQHRYCSNLYPKAETYRVCNWCLIQKDDQDNHTTNTNSSINNNSSNSSSQENSTPKSTSTTNVKKFNNINHTTSNGPRSPKCLHPNSPIKKPMRSPDSGSPSGRRRLISQEEKERLMLRRTKSSQEMSKNNNNININNNHSNYNNSSFISSNRSNGGPSSGVGASGGGPAVIKHVFRNKVRRYKLLDEVSS